MKPIVVSAFADLARIYGGRTGEELLGLFIQRYGLTWATDVAKYVPAGAIRANRPEYHEFYFDEDLPLSVRCEPRSGMFSRSPDAEGGRAELLLHLALGLEGLAQLIKVPRTIDGGNMTVSVAGRQMEIDKTGFEEDFEHVAALKNNEEAEWSDELVRPSYEDSLLEARDALIQASSAETFDEDSLHELLNVMLCGAHCQGCPPHLHAGIRMAKIMAVSGAIRGAGKRLKASTGS